MHPIRRRQQGMTVIETLGALAIASLLVLGLSNMIDTSLDDAKGQQAALHQTQVVNAANKYIAANYADLVANTAGGAVAAITMAQLKAGGFLTPSFSNANAFRQASCVLVRQATVGKLDALVSTYGGLPIADRDIPLVAMLSGQGGGYISAAAPDTARGASWDMATTSYRNVACGAAGGPVLTGAAANDGGHLVSSLFYDGPGQLAKDFLYRNAVPGRPELNQMNEPITMAANALVTPGAACGGNAAFGVEESSRSLVVCGKDGRWKQLSTWKEPVPHHGDLPVTGNLEGDTRMVTSLKRAFTYGAGGWAPLAVDENGNMNVPHTLSADRVHALTEVSTDGMVTAQRDMIAQGKVIGEVGVEGDYVLGRYWVEGQSLYVNQPVNAGERCHIPIIRPDGTPAIIWAVGTIKIDPNGTVLACTGPDLVFKYQNGTLTP